MQDYSSNVAHGLTSTTENYHRAEEPKFEAIREADVCDGKDCEESTEEGICAKAGVVTIDCSLDRTCLRDRSAIVVMFRWHDFDVL